MCVPARRAGQARPSSHSRRVTWCMDVLVGLELALQLAHQAVALGHHVVLVDRLQVLLARHHEDARRRAARTRRPPCGSPRARSPRRSADGGARARRPRPRRGASSARRSRSSSTPRRSGAGGAPRSGCRSSPGSRRTACRARAGCAWRPARARRRARSRRRRSRRPPAARARGRIISSCAHGHAVMPCACTPTSRRVPRSDATADPISPYMLCVRMPETGAVLVLRVARGDRHLGAQPALAVAHVLGDVRGERLGLERLAEHDLVDRLLDDLLEARHVRALLLRVEVDERLDLRVEELLALAGADPDRLVHAGYANSRQRHVRRRAACLHVVSGMTEDRHLASHTRHRR